MYDKNTTDENELIDNNESLFIDQVKLIDVEIAEVEKRITETKANESALVSALRAARTSEHTATSVYSQTPNARSQKALENARDFVTSCQSRVDTFHSSEGALSGDVSMLWQQRKQIIGELSRFRHNKIRPNLEHEADVLISEISKKAKRYLSLMSHLDGMHVLRLNMDRLLLRHNPEHKNDLIIASDALKKSFENLIKVDF